ncbi:MAG: 6-hydroxymethylpterin diphosphokinase MptE-like protein [Chlamydiota bacterium]|nr:6-hydroxymethylpterin diphosphokinase MptE-like protein [Chlamydiota bacterium]
MIKNTYSQEFYERNLVQFARYDSSIAESIPKAKCEGYEFCTTHLGELNLKCPSYYFYDNEGSFQQLKKQSLDLPFDKQEVIFYYGLGLGYCYTFINEWLKKNDRHTLIIIEDDICVLKKFLSTEYASIILSDPQVIVHYMPVSTEDIKGSMHDSLEELIKGFVFKKAFLTCSQVYTENKNSRCVELRDLIYLSSRANLYTHRELIEDRKILYSNFYRNILSLHGSSYGHCLENTMKDTPAIICGAGSSIVNSIDTIKSLNNKALVIGSGTGMNILNHFGVEAHFGVGIDPYESQGSRIRTNSAFETPYFYRLRFHADSLNLLHGPKLLIQGQGNYNILNWFLEKFGVSIQKNEDLEISTTNVAMGIAHMLGCNPIILVGCDLAYTNNNRYPDVITAHPTDGFTQRKGMEFNSKDVVFGKTEEGEPILTKVDWLEEANMIKIFSDSHPNTSIINASGKGLFIEGVKSMRLEDINVGDKNTFEDLPGKIHSLIQCSQPVTTQPTVLNVIEEWRGSLEKCLNICHRKIDEVKQLWKKCELGHELSDREYEGLYVSFEDSFSDEPAYNYLLKSYRETFENIAIRHEIKFRCHSYKLTAINRNHKKLEFYLNYIHYCKEHLEFHIRLVAEIVARENVNIPPASSLHSNKKIIPTIDEKGKVVCYHHENGKILSKFYTSDGKRSHFYPSGKLYSLSKSDEGQRRGTHKFYYENGNVKSEINYKGGSLHGEVVLYYANGRKKRELHFDKGKLHGTERYWSQDGQLIWEAQYDRGSPTGTAKSWYSNGRQHTVVKHFNKEGKLYVFEWDCSGKLVSKEVLDSPSKRIKGDDISKVIEKFEKNIDYSRKFAEYSKKYLS